MAHGNFKLTLITMDTQLSSNFTIISLLQHQKMSKERSLFFLQKPEHHKCSDNKVVLS